MNHSHRLLNGSAITGGIEDVERALGLQCVGPTVVTSLDGSAHADAAANETMYRAAVHALKPSPTALRDYARSAAEYRRQTSCASRLHRTVMPRTRARGAGRPRVRRTVRSAARSGSSGDDGSGLAGGGDPAHRRPALVKGAGS